MLNLSVKPNYSQLKDNPFKEYFQEENDNEIFQKSFCLFSKEYFGNIIGEKEYKETALETKINKKLDEEKNTNIKKSLYISTKEIKSSNLEQSLKDIGVLSSESEQNLSLRRLPEISDEKFNEIQNEIFNNDSQNQLYQLYEQLENVYIDFKNPECNISIGGISPLAYLIKKYYNFDKEKEQEIKDKYNLLEPFVFI